MRGRDRRVAGFTTPTRRSRDAYHGARLAAPTRRVASLGFTYGWTLRVDRPATIRSGGPRGGRRSCSGDVDFYRHRSACLGELAHCHALLGDVAAAEAALAEADAVAVPSFVMDHSFVELARAWIAHARGESHRGTPTRRRVRRAMRDRTARLAFAAFAWHDVARLGDPHGRRRPLQSLAAVSTATWSRRSPPTPPRSRPATPARSIESPSAFEQMGAVLYAAEAAAAAARALTGAMGGPAARSRRPPSAQRLAEQCEGARTPALAELDALAAAHPPRARDRHAWRRAV